MQEVMAHKKNGSYVPSTNASIQGMLKNAASGVLAHWPCSRTPPYAPLVQAAAALLDGPF
ncbi:hypothetical protein PJI16_06425 [Nitrospira sp. MA-1]|nr:hypothetical protein [Nitrospira sp. MA-1]